MIESVTVDTYGENLNPLPEKRFYVIKKNKFIIDWFRPFIDRSTNELGSLHIHSNDVQQQNVISISSNPTESDLLQKTYSFITRKNIIPVVIYYAVRKFVVPTWLNNRDQFLYPNDGWKSDKDFHNDCLAYTLFNNNIQSKFGINHWIPYSEDEVNAQEKFESNFMKKFIDGKIEQE